MDIAYSEDVVFQQKLPPGTLSLPIPETVRDKARQSADPRAKRLSRPPPVRFPSLGLIVKYGPQVSITEAQCLILIRKFLPTVPVPEVYGWCQDGRQTFIYMELVDGRTLEQSWDDLYEENQLVICQELRTMVKAWRGLPQDLFATGGDSDAPFIG
jgi:hypothetical protein